jgi:hypothetical protein
MLKDHHHMLFPHRIAEAGANKENQPLPSARRLGARVMDSRHLAPGGGDIDQFEVVLGRKIRDMRGQKGENEGKKGKPLPQKAKDLSALRRGDEVFAGNPVFA